MIKTSCNYHIFKLTDLLYKLKILLNLPNSDILKFTEFSELVNRAIIHAKKVEETCHISTGEIQGKLVMIKEYVERGELFKARKTIEDALKILEDKLSGGSMEISPVPKKEVSRVVWMEEEITTPLIRPVLLHDVDYEIIKQNTERVMQELGV